MCHVIPKVEPRLQGFKLKEILFNNVQIKWNQTENISWYEIRANGKSHNYEWNRLKSYKKNQTSIEELD